MEVLVGRLGQAKTKLYTVAGTCVCGDARVRAVHNRRSTGIPHAKHGFFDVQHLRICLLAMTTKSAVRTSEIINGMEIYLH
jgi:hypothetical protein